MPPPLFYGQAKPRSTGISTRASGAERRAPAHCLSLSFDTAGRTRKRAPCRPVQSSPVTLHVCVCVCKRESSSGGVAVCASHRPGVACRTDFAHKQHDTLIKKQSSGGHQAIFALGGGIELAVISGKCPRTFLSFFSYYSDYNHAATSTQSRLVRPHSLLRPWRWTTSAAAAAHAHRRRSCRIPRSRERQPRAVRH